MMKEKLSALRCELDRILEEMERLSSRIDAVCSEIDVLMEEDMENDATDDSRAGSEALDIEVDMPSFGNEKYADAAEASLPEPSVSEDHDDWRHDELSLVSESSTLAELEPEQEKEAAHEDATETADEPMLFSDLPREAPHSGRTGYLAINDAASPARSIIDGYRDDYAWRSDRPGTPVNDIRSAVTLNDRVLFINTLFGSDPVRFKNAVEVINTLDSLDSMLDYISSEGYDWDYASETVYKFIMAARRKLG